ncbi:MAG TPA: HAMP domain-containing sensor histidine kinase [Actinomycetes bacterium]|nr:HAMP domain-containing sensor histidine kinase [Actinomycetes bacterium]
MSRLGLRGRIVLASVGTLALGVGALSITVNVLLARVLDADAATVLRARADAQLVTVPLTGDRVAVEESPGEEALDPYGWVFVHGRAIERAAAPPAVQQAVEALRTTRTSSQVDVGRLRLRAQPAYDADGRTQVGAVVVGLSLVPYQDTKRIALVGSLLLDGLVLVVAASVVRRAVGRPLRLVAEMTHSAARWSEHDLDRRFDLGVPRDELSGLAATLDGLLDRIARSRRNEQRFSAEMAHELRTPLSGIRAEAELALRRRNVRTEAREALLGILDGAKRTESVIQTLLSVARREATDGDALADAAEAAGVALDGVRPAAERRGVELLLEQAASSVWVAAHGHVAVQALRPLLDNAVRHARRAVTLRIAVDRGRVTFTVSDDGDGIPPAVAEDMFEPGWRGAGGGAAGLGLSLSRRLARICGGEVTAVASPAGGCFVLDLPAGHEILPGAVQVD